MRIPAIFLLFLFPLIAFADEFLEFCPKNLSKNNGNFWLYSVKDGKVSQKLPWEYSSLVCGGGNSTAPSLHNGKIYEMASVEKCQEIYDLMAKKTGASYRFKVSNESIKPYKGLESYKKSYGSVISAEEIPGTICKTTSAVVLSFKLKSDLSEAKYQEKMAENQKRHKDEEIKKLKEYEEQRRARPSLYATTIAVDPESKKYPNHAYLGCDYLEAMQRKQPYKCDPYTGDTSCEESLPVLCFKKNDKLIKPERHADHDFKYVNSWSGGEVKASKRIKGEKLTSASAADNICKGEFGTEWSMAKFSPFQWRGILAKGDLKADTRYWVNIQYQKTNCWDK